jgi:dihydroorotate dehydrogenase electron transfer subunit
VSVADRVLAPLGRRTLEVTGSERHGAYRVLTAADPDGPRPRAGQFYMLAAATGWGGGTDERPFLPRAFSVLRAHPDGGLDFLLEDVGPGTHRLAQLRPGDGLHVLGPLGNGFHPDRGRRAILAGGGVGIAPLAILADELGASAAVLLGFRDAAHAEGAALLPGARLATDDGSAGHHGLVTDLLRAELGTVTSTGDPSLRGSEGETPLVYACGPPPMLEAVRAICAADGVPGQLALESGMACGYGACFGCVVPTRDGYLRLCVDGPVLDAASLEEVG